MAAAETGDLSDASDETVEQQHGSEHDTDESDVDDGGAADQPAVVITSHACGGEDTLTVVSVALAQSRGGGRPSRRGSHETDRDARALHAPTRPRLAGGP